MTEAGTRTNLGERVESQATGSSSQTAVDTAAVKAARFSVDDAFSDDGEDDAKFEFSSDAVKKDRDRIGEDSTQDDEESIHTSPPPSHSSISTFNLDQDHYSATHSPPSSPEDVRESSEHERSRTPEGRIPKNDGVENGDSFPSVVIDLSQSPSHRVVVLSEPVADGTAAAPSDHTDNLSSLSTSRSNGEVPPLRSPSKLSTPNDHNRRPPRTTGPSALEKVVSKTRPAYLPPKAKEEDVKHMTDWERMMKQSRLAEEQRKKQREERRIARERAIEESIHIWESSILPDWKTAVRDPAVRKMWWNGVPPKLRGIAWEKTIGNSLALSKDTYKTCLARAKRALSAGSFPTTTLNLMESDICSTLPSLNLFHPSTGPLYEDLKDLLCAWVVSRSDEGLGYAVGVGKIAAMLLLNLPPPAAFVSMRNLLERHCMRSFYGGLSYKEDVEAYYRIFDTLLADCMPKVYFNFKQHQVSPAAYLPDWIMSLFLEHLPLDACARVWDVLALEGDSFIFRAALAVLASLESRLFFPDRQELLSLLQGQNKAALDVAKREGRVLGSYKYEIYGIDEEALWSQIDAMQEWWKESTWSRLIQRELPDL